MTKPAKSSATIEAVLFDLDDTLWPIGPTIQRAEAVQYAWLEVHAPRLLQMHSKESLRARRMELAAGEPRFRFDLWSLRHTALREALASSGEDAAKADEAMAVFSRERNIVALFDDVVPGLRHLGERFRLGSVSNGFADLEAIGLAGHFGVSIAAHRLGFAKPEPRIFHMACEALQVAPQHAVYVGDDLLLDVQGAQQAGLHGVWMNRFGRELKPGAEPDAVCASLHELIAWLDRNKA